MRAIARYTPKLASAATTTAMNTTTTVLVVRFMIRSLYWVRTLKMAAQPLLEFLPHDGDGRNGHVLVEGAAAYQRDDWPHEHVSVRIGDRHSLELQRCSSSTH